MLYTPRSFRENGRRVLYTPRSFRDVGLRLAQILTKTTSLLGSLAPVLESLKGCAARTLALQKGVSPVPEPLKG